MPVLRQGNTEFFNFCVRLLLLCSPIAGLAQSTDFQFDNLTMKDGLSTNSVLSICQDSLGFMWFGTEDGLSRYDGHTIKVYRRIEGDSTSLEFNNITGVDVDESGNLWVVGRSLHRYDRANDRFVRYPHIPGIPRTPEPEVETALSDQNGILWIGSNAGLYRFDRGTGIPGRIEIGAVKTIASIVDDHAGNLWLGILPPGVVRLNKSTLQFERIPGFEHLQTSPVLYADKSLTWIFSGSSLFQTNSQGKHQLVHVSSGTLSAVCDGGEGKLWLGTYSDGLELFDRTTHSSVIVRHSSSDPRSLISSSIVGLYVDRQGSLWVATPDGISVLSKWGKRFKRLEHNTENPNSVVDGEVRTILEDSRGDLWIGTFGGGLTRWVRETGLFHNYPNPGGLTWEINVAYEDHEGTMWIGTTTGLLKWNRKSDTFSVDHLDSVGLRMNVSALLEDGHGALWVGTQDGLFVYNRVTRKRRRYTLDTTAGRCYVPAIYEDFSRRLWVSVAVHGGRWALYEYDRTRDTVVSRQGGNIWSLCEDRAHRLWLGTSEGLMRYDREGDSLNSALTENKLVVPQGRGTKYWGDFLIPVLTESKGLHGKMVFGIVEDDQGLSAHRAGNLWLSTDKGLTKYDPDTHALRNFGINDGYPFSGSSDLGWGYHGPCYKKKNGEMMFGVGNGYVVFHPDSIRDNPDVPPVVITDFKLFNEPVRIAPDSPLKQSITQSKSITLSHDQNTIAFEFAALDYTAPANNQYAYQLAGFDQGWVRAGTRTFAQYTNLPPGEYVFRVKGSNSDGVWNEQGISLGIIITPPWWKTLWAYIGYGLAIAGVLYSIRRSEKHRDGLRHQAELAHARVESLQEVDSLKSRFFANISHEFRTPLTLILGPIEKLKVRIGDPEMGRDLSLMERNAHRLLRLINQLLDLSRLEGGAMKLQVSRGNIVSFVKGLTSSFETSAGMRRIAINIHADRDEIEVYFDKDKMEKILTNLLSNAFKFTPEGGNVVVQISNSKFQDPNLLEITIADTGIGIPADELPRVFDRFYQVDSSQTREHEGSGIGLALTKELVELHHGSISVKSEVGKGTEFTVLLPLGRDHLKDEEIVEREEREPTPEPLRVPLERDEVRHRKQDEIPTEGREIPQMDELSRLPDGQATSLGGTSRNDTAPLVLVVEDNADVRAYMKEYLVSIYNVQEAHDGVEGIEKAKETIPDLIISDVMMPKKDGYELCKTLKLDEKTSHIPIILLTAKAGAENKIEGLETGADDYLTKPFDAKELLVRVKNLIDLRRKLRERFSVGQVLKPGDIAVTSIDDAFLQKAMFVVEQRMGDEEFGVEQLRDELGMSRTQLHRKLTALTNQSAGDFIRYMRLQRAKDLLKQNAGTVAEIAFQVGFNSVAYFTKCFREHFGVVPSEIRSKIE